MGVSPFGYLRINGYLLLPAAFRSLSRLSSSLSAKASTLRSYWLDLLKSFRPASVPMLSHGPFRCASASGMYSVTCLYGFGSHNLIDIAQSPWTGSGRIYAERCLDM